MLTKRVEIQDLEVGFQTSQTYTTAVNKISFSIGKGEVVGVVGESGSGKSVTALSLMRLIEIPGVKTAGKLLFEPTDHTVVNLLQLSDATMRTYRGKEISMVFQEPMTALNPLQTCGRQVAEVIRQHKDVSLQAAEEEVLKLFERVKLPDPPAIFKRYPHEISGGQKQRVMIAMAIAVRPSLLIADEPTTALDVTVQKTVLDLLKELQSQLQMSVLFITHDLGVVSEIADRVVVMYKGNIVEEGPVREVLHHPRHPYTRGLLACRPPLDRKLYRLPVTADFMTVDSQGGIHEKPNAINELIDKLTIPATELNDRRKQLAEARPVLEVEGLQTWFPAEKSFTGQVKRWMKAVDGVSFRVAPGETMGLVGESGCGKTTLGRSILRLVEPTGGSVVYKGQDIRSLSATGMRHLRKEMQLIFQDPYASLNPRITVGAAILEPMQVHGLHGTAKQQQERVEMLLEKVSLPAAFYHRYPHELSGGQRQRIVIARALAVSPSFIVCDESVAALDVSVQAQVLNLLIGLRAEFGFTSIFISHDLSVVRLLSDRMMVMQRGKIVEAGWAEEVYNSPQTPYTQQLISAIPKII
ncbi:peptide/nickel transport system ATP-binding protein [Chitinophaga terrae (ex Kim and Jung 2007)]|uniref:Peptide/nickel transport system ATP-binding protein n=1 Tax=Chitinophaga terrae (ex Kim and Jung 2007) TaxID=408074 RepID=A0A1H4FJQ3_9BACT|nr:ABC transporter ATP-binding protein [Chitinophaga terrae (ex Kim and Jung 2007)]GEP92456.1 ABC transporter ATP-binding protein [Chitinophaga terrae (ex Kim and Jung 2007)]SEA97505.1 peptide/nickel transport system ATP-binding protein [Chitinophaga terrae (ex Kim and Jung 2007)]